MLLRSWLSRFVGESLTRLSSLSGPPPRRGRSRRRKQALPLSGVESLESRQLLSAADDYLATMATLQSLADGAIADAQLQIDAAVADFRDAWNDAVGDWTTGEAGAQAQYDAIENPAWTQFHSVQSGAQSQFTADAQAALDDWIADEDAAWTQFTGIEIIASDQRDADLDTAESLFSGVIDAANTIWTTTESSARSFADSEIDLAESIWDGIETIAFGDLESDVDAAEQAAESTITGLQSQANQAWTDYLATLAPGETPAVSQQPPIDMSLAMIPGLSSAVMASLLGGPPASELPSVPRSTQIWVAARDLTGSPVGTHRFLVVSWNQNDTMPQEILDLLGESNGLRTNTPRALGGGRVGFTIGGHKINGVLIPVFNQYADLQSYREGTDPRAFPPEDRFTDYDLERTLATMRRTPAEIGRMLRQMASAIEQYNTNRADYDWYSNNCNAWVNGLLNATGQTNLQQCELPGVAPGTGQYHLQPRFLPPQATRRIHKREITTWKWNTWLCILSPFSFMGYQLCQAVSLRMSH